MRMDGARTQPEPLKIKRVPWRARRRSLDLVQSLLERLAAWNLDLWSPERILAELELADEDLEALRRLSLRPDGWQIFEFDARAPLSAGRPAALGLVEMARWRRRIRLTEAGRFLLLLADIDPKIKKALPAGGRKAETDESLQ